MPTNINIKRKRGDTRRMVFVVRSGGVAVPINGWSSFLLTVDPSRSPPNTDNNILQIVGELASDGLDGRISFSPDGLADVGKYYYDAQATDGNSEKATFAEGKYELTQDITKN